MNFPNDFATDSTPSDVSKRLSAALELVLHAFINTIEGQDVPTHFILQSKHGHFLKLQTEAHEKPNEWEHFFIWRGHVLAYRINYTQVVDDNAQHTDLTVALQTKHLTKDEYPEPLTVYLRGEKET